MAEVLDVVDLAALVDIVGPVHNGDERLISPLCPSEDNGAEHDSIPVHHGGDVLDIDLCAIGAFQDDHHILCFNDAAIDDREVQADLISVTGFSAYFAWTGS